MALYGAVSCAKIFTLSSDQSSVATLGKIYQTTSRLAVTAAQAPGALVWPATPGGVTGLRRREGTHL